MTTTTSEDLEFFIAGLMEDINRRIAFGANERDIIIIMSRETYLVVRNRYRAGLSFPIDADADGTIKFGQLYGFDVYVIDQSVTSDGANCMFVAYRRGAIDGQFLSNGDYVLWDNSLYITHLDNNDARETHSGVFRESGLTVCKSGTMADLINTRRDEMDSALYATVYATTSASTAYSGIQWDDLVTSSATSANTRPLDSAVFLGDLENALRSVEFGQSRSAKKRARKKIIEQEMQDSPELDAFLQTFKSAT